MIRIGFIGYGSMGSMLVSGIIRSGLVNQEQLIITRKDKSKLQIIKDTWPGVNIAESALKIARTSDYIFICVKPLEYKSIIEEIAPVINPKHHIITIAGSIMLADLEHKLGCKLTKLLPTVISEVGEGISLICHNNKVTKEDADFLEQLIGSFSKLSKIREEDFDFSSELTSVGPGLIAAIFDELLQSAARYTDTLPKEVMEDMLLQTIYGTIRLMQERSYRFEDVIARVATKGGITEEGVKIFKAGLPETFDEMFHKTMSKRSVINEKIHNEFHYSK
jgi:pyrroline-5-carboxylate reductase